ncbi:MAG: type III-A CRISPR-associated protein Csm2 [Actinomycetota bacterium]|nr:type III-A CRISPR-associated protein Csm2 [Actinomycetota bacterium]
MGRQRGGFRPDNRGGAMREATGHVGSLGRLKEWGAADLVSRADAVGGELSRRMSTSQIRNFLDEVNRIQAETQGKRHEFDSSRVILLKPLLAYAAGRETNRERQGVLKEFANLFSAAADKVEDASDFKQFVEFTRAVVAYHRFHGGSNQ